MTGQRPRPQLLTPEDVARIQWVAAGFDAAFQNLVAGTAAHLSAVLHQPSDRA